MTSSARQHDPEVSRLNEEVRAALAQTRSLVEEIHATVISLEEFRQTKRVLIFGERQGSDHD